MMMMMMIAMMVMIVREAKVAEIRAHSSYKAKTREFNCLRESLLRLGESLLGFRILLMTILRL